MGTAEYAPDGVISADWRLVRKTENGGRVKIYGAWWEHPKLAQFVGRRVWVSVGDYWGTEVHVFSHRGPRWWICKIEAGCA